MMKTLITEFGHNGYHLYRISRYSVMRAVRRVIPYKLYGITYTAIISNTPTAAYVNGKASTNKNFQASANPAGNRSITVNLNPAGLNRSDWAVMELLVYDRALSGDEMYTVSAY